MSAGTISASRVRLWAPLLLTEVAGVLAFHPVFSGWAFLIAGLGGLLLGAGLAYVLVWRSVPWYLAVPIVLVAYVLFAAPLALRTDALAGLLPSVATIAEAGRGVATSWKDLLTVEAPVYGFDTTLLVPYLAAYIAGLASTLLVLRSKRPAWGLLPSVALLLVAVVFGTYLVSLPVVAAVGVALGGALWLSWVRREGRIQGTARSDRAAPGWPAVASGVAMLGIAAAAAWGVGGAAAAEGSRDVLRNYVVPPFDVHDYASPLQSWRGLESNLDAPVLFTASGLPDGARIRLATLDSYDGTVFGVGATGQAGSGTFLALTRGASPAASGDSYELSVTMGELGSVWLPDIGALQTVDFDDEVRRTIYYNAATGTAVVPSGLASGTSYTINGTWVPEPSAAELARDSFASISVPPAVNVPQSVVDAAQEAAGNANSDSERMEALASWLRDTGYFSHGVTEEEPPSVSGHHTVRIDTLLAAEQMVGDDEQYAVALALMARSLGIPTRVVMGFYPEGSASGSYAVTAQDLHAWVEVSYVDAGWVAYDAAPDPDKAIPDTQQPPRHQAVPQVLQPPPPPAEPDTAPPADAIEDQAVQGNSPLLEAVVRVLWVGLASAVALAILLSPFVLVLAAKSRRRKARRAASDAAEAVAGAWDELADSALDAGVRLQRGATRAEHGVAVDSQLTSTGALVLARRVDAGVFGPDDWDREQIDALWADVDAYLAAAHQGTGRFRAWTRRLSLRSLAHRRSVLTSRGGDR